MHRLFENDHVYLECIKCHKMIDIGTCDEYKKLTKQLGGPISVLMCKDCKPVRKKEDKNE